MTKKLYLVDAMAHIYRAFYAPMVRMNTPAGVPTTVPFLFNNILRRILKDYQPDYVGIVFDTSKPTFRDKLFEEYKAHRPKMPDELSIQLPFVRKLCEALHLPILEWDGYEADDVLGALAKQSKKAGVDVVLVTNDKDMLQLVGEGVRVLRTGTGAAKSDVFVDEKKVEEILGVPPDKVIDVMALMGDSIDNIPGARDPNDKPAPGERRKPGIGEVGAREIILKFGSAEEALRRADEVKRASYREALQKNGKYVMLSKELSKIDSDVPIVLDLPNLQRREPDLQALAALYRELGFNSLLKELGSETVASTAPVSEMPVINVDYAQLTNATELREYLAKIPAKEPVAIWLNVEAGDRESEGFGTRIAAIEVSSKPGEGRAVWIDEKGEALATLQPLLANKKQPKIVHDAKLLHLLLGRMENVQHATQIYSYLLQPTTGNHNFTDVVMRQFNAMVGGGPGERADFLQRLGPALRGRIGDEQVSNVYEKIDLPLAPVLADMERTGIRIDPRALDVMSGTMEGELRRLEKDIWEMAGVEFNVNSPAQLAEILFDKLNLQPSARRGKVKGRSTAVEILEELSAKHPLPRKVIEYREISKLKSTYVDSLPRLVNRETGRLHTSYSQTNASTGRLSSSDPNLQNIPIRTELGREIRAAFVADEGKVLLSADYSQIELRVMAHFSQDPVLLEAFQQRTRIFMRARRRKFLGWAR